MSEEIKYEKKGHVGVITVDRPDKLNSFSDQMLRDCTKLLYDLDFDEELRCLILTGTGRSFSTGSDLGEASMFDPYQMALEVAHGQLLTGKLERFRTPVIAAVNGYAVGGGLEIALSCDIRLCNEKAKFGLGEINVGTIAGWCGVYRLPEVVGESHAKMIQYTGRNISAEEAYRIGLVEEVLAPDDLMPRAMELAETIASKAPLAEEAIKRLIRGGRASFDGATDVAPLVHSEDFKEAMSAFVEKRPNRGYNRR